MILFFNLIFFCSLGERRALIYTIHILSSHLMGCSYSMLSFESDSGVCFLCAMDTTRLLRVLFSVLFEALLQRRDRRSRSVVL